MSANKIYAQYLGPPQGIDLSPFFVLRYEEKPTYKDGKRKPDIWLHPLGTTTLAYVLLLGAMLCGDL